MSMRSISSTALKFALTSAIILTIAAAISSVGDEASPISEADALIFDRGPVEPNRQKRFADVLRDYGMTAPTAYDYNGQTVYVSSGTTRHSPRRFLRDIQHTLEEEGVNHHAHTEVQGGDTSVNARSLTRDFRAGEDFLTGGLVPTEVGEHRVAMAGIETKYDADNLRELTRAFVEDETVPGAEMLERFRYLEAFRGDNERRTQMLAYWSDDSFDLDALRRGGDGGANESPGTSGDMPVPPCPTCRTITHLDALGRSGRQTVLLEGTAPPSRIEAFYQRTLRSRGWKASSTLESVDRLERRYDLGPTRGEQQRYAAFYRDEQFVSMLLYSTEDDRTRVKVMATRRP